MMTDESAIANVLPGGDCRMTVVDNVWSRSKGGNAGQSRYMVFYGSVHDTTTYPAADFQSQAVISGNKATYSADLLADYLGVGAYPVTRIPPGHDPIDLRLYGAAAASALLVIASVGYWRRNAR